MLQRVISGIALVGVALTLGGCVHVSAPPPTRAAAVPHPGDETRVYGVTRAEVRTTSGGMPLTGASCRLIAQTMSLEFHTPAVIEMPILHRPLAPATLNCRFAGREVQTVLHATRLMELRDDDPDRPFGYALGQVARIASGVTNMWSYMPTGTVMTIDMGS
ncbi:hypothetical protein [Pseudooceanicola onchidii]|uniref:hypothetical protein n=1 Tax=Pseudooceanicola onchidii TaxID=2562279 RepID=UPI0010A9EAE7|nr:hypothetical protein [Pseudooceanicola onchidii]